MAHIDAFKIGDTKIELNDDNYSEKRGFYEYTQQTEAGTMRRDVVRIGYLDELSVKITATGAVKSRFDTASQQNSLSLTIWKDGSNSAGTWNCYISSYSADLVRDTNNSTYWDISVTFKDLEAG